MVMKFSELAPRERHNFVYFLLFFFFYYFIMSAYFPFFPVWLADVNHLTKTETGIVSVSCRHVGCVDGIFYTV